MKTFISRLKNPHTLSLGGLMVADAVVFGTTNPRSAPSFLLIVGFLLLSATIYCLFDGLLAVPAVYGFHLRHKRRLVGTLTALTGALVALQSIGQLGSRDVLVLLLLTLLLSLYAASAKSMRQNLQAKQL